MNKARIMLLVVPDQLARKAVWARMREIVHVRGWHGLEQGAASTVFARMNEAFQMRWTIRVLAARTVLQMKGQNTAFK